MACDHWTDEIAIGTGSNCCIGPGLERNSAPLDERTQLRNIGVGLKAVLRQPLADAGMRVEDEAVAEFAGFEDRGPFDTRQ